MFMNWIFAAMAAVAGYYAVNAQIDQTTVPMRKSEDLALNMSVYRAAVTAWAEHHPAFSGTVQDSDLAFPSWYHRYPLWTNRIDGATVAVYPSQTPELNVAAEIVSLSKNSMLAGVARNAQLYSPVFGETGIALPSGIPDGVPVWLARLR